MAPDTRSRTMNHGDDVLKHLFGTVLGLNKRSPAYLCLQPSQINTYTDFFSLDEAFVMSETAGLKSGRYKDDNNQYKDAPLAAFHRHTLKLLLKWNQYLISDNDLGASVTKDEWLGMSKEDWDEFCTGPNTGVLPTVPAPSSVSSSSSRTPVADFARASNATHPRILS